MDAAPRAPAAQPWRSSFPDVADWDAPILIGTVPELLARGLALSPDRPAIEFRGQRQSFRALAAAVERTAGGLLAAGIAPGDPVALYLPNTPWHPIAFFALARIGARIVHLTPLDAPRELAFKLADSGARVVVTTDLPGLLPAALGLLEAGAERVLVGADARWGPSGAPPVEVPWGARVQPMPEADPPPAWPAVGPDDICLLQYTGGTTGVPKAALLTHGNLTAAVSMYNNWRGAVTWLPGEHRVAAVLPLFHIYALTTVLLRSIAMGNEMLLRLRFDPAAALADISQQRVTVFPGVPTMWIALANHPDAAGCDFSSLRYCGSGGAPMPFEVRERVQRLIGRPLLGGWGMTETAPAGTQIPPGAPPIPGLIGIPLPGLHLKIVDRTDPSIDLSPGETGELAISGANVCQGYWRRPEETAASFHDGYLLTGDIGAMDERGLFRLFDRKKNMIISGGFNVYPAQVENAIYEHPSVAEVIVIGVPDAYRGEAAKAFVTLRPGAEALTLDALRAFLADRLGKHEMPAALEVRSDLPRSPAGKLLAKVLRDEERAKMRGSG